jgi:hypothetical protein
MGASRAPTIRRRRHCFGLFAAPFGPFVLFALFALVTLLVFLETTRTLPGSQDGIEINIGKAPGNGKGKPRITGEWKGLAVAGRWRDERSKKKRGAYARMDVTSGEGAFS